MLEKLPKEIGNLESLQSLTLIDAGYLNFPSSITKLSNLKELNLCRSYFSNEFIQILEQIPSLERFHIIPIKEIPKKIGNLGLFYKRMEEAVYYSKDFIEKFENKENIWSDVDSLLDNDYYD